MTTPGNGVFGPVSGQPDPSATPQATANTGGATVTRQAFAVAILNKLGYPQTPQNIGFLVAWMNREGTAAAYNPLATKQKYNGSYDLPGNSPGDPSKVQQYQSFDDGVTATVKTLLNGRYTDILTGLKSGDAQTAGASGQMERGLHTWSGGGYSSIGGNADPNAAISTGGTGGASSSSGGTQLSGQSLVDYAESNFPQYAYLLHDPEVGPILVKAAQEGVTDPNILAGMLRNTNWWKNTSSTARDFNELMANDPATANQAIENTIAKVNRLAAQMGVGIDPTQAHDIAVNYRKLGWTDDQLTQQVATYAKYQGDITYKGEAATDVDALRGIYKSMALPVSDATLNKQLQDVLGGKLTPQQVQDQAAQQAATLYASNPQLAQFLKSGGGTVQDWANPYITRAAQLLGQNADNLDLSAPLWAKVLQPATDPKTGASTGQAMSLDQWETMIRNDPKYGFDSSTNGIQQGAQLGGALGKILGTDGL